MSNEPSERAEREADVLKLVFGDNVLSIKTRDCWKRFTHLEVCLHVVLPNSSSVQQPISVDLDVKCPPEYPNLPPKFSLLKPVGLTHDDLYELTKLLNKKTNELTGSELIYDLYVEAQNFLQTKMPEPSSMHEKMVIKQETALSAPPSRQPNRSRSESIRSSYRNSFTEHELPEAGPGEIDEKDETKCRREQLLKQIGDSLGASTKVELLAKSGQLVDLQKITSSKPPRKPMSNLSQEYFGLVQDRVVFVTEYRFDSAVNRRNKDVLVGFEGALKRFAEAVKSQSLPTDNFLTQFAFVYLRREKRAKFSYDLLIGQYIDLESRCLSDESVSKLLKERKSAILPKLTNHLICGLRALHEQRFVHGNFGMDSIWMTADKNFFISDHSLMLELLNLCDTFEQVNLNAGRRQQTSLYSWRLKDLQRLGSLLEPFSSNVDLSTRETLSDFISLCHKTDADAQRLLNHRYLYQGFLSATSSDDESIQSIHDLVSFENSGRLVKEYNVLSLLGSGGFGSVALARNKLDGNYYAVKAIPLSGIPRRQVERIKNEVSVFSRLTHQHIVRYFSSWVETTSKNEQLRTDTTSDSFNAEASLESDLLPENIRNLNKEQEKHVPDRNDDESESSSSAVGFFRKPMVSHRGKSRNRLLLSQATSDLSIRFTDDDDDKLPKLASLIEEESESNSDTADPTTSSYLCLQMEYCKNKTLRAWIDSGTAYNNSAAIWRIFREILLGLEFLHSYSLIHRDIKPGNIFLDSNWSVKIGDFGLVTRLATSADPDESGNQTQKEGALASHSMTKDIGTFLYIPPEARRNDPASSAKSYDTKFDIYSTGIVLFEMILKPPPTAIERIRCLEELRDSLTIPDNFTDNLPENQKRTAESIVKWCLYDVPSERPTASELLESGLIPRIRSEEENFKKTCSQILQDPKHRLRRLFFNELFSPLLQPTQSFIYDRNLCIETAKKRRIAMLSHEMINMLSDLFQLQGFSFVPVEALFPSPDNYPIDDKSAGSLASTLARPYKVVDENGFVLQFPTSLRHTFTRYCAHNAISRSKTFCVDKVLSQPSTPLAYPSHPDVRLEFCVDLIRPLNSNASTSAAIEVLEVAIKIARKLRASSSVKWQILVNSVSLVKAIALHFGIEDEHETSELFNLLYNYSSRDKKADYNALAFELTRHCDLSDQQALELLQLIDFPVRSTHKLREHLRPVVNSKNSTVHSLVESSIAEMDAIFQSICHNLDPSLELIYLPSFVYQPSTFFDGVVFSLRAEFTDKSKKSFCTLLSGGRYDTFLRKNRKINEHESALNTCAYGFNLSVENSVLVFNKSGGVLSEANECSTLVLCTSLNYYNAGQAFADKLRTSIPVELWREEFALNDSLFEYCHDKFINFIVALVSADDCVVYVNSFDKSIGNSGFRLAHNRISLAEAHRSIASIIAERKDLNEGDSYKVTEAKAERLEVNAPVFASLGNVNLVFCVSGAFKLTHHLRKKYESHAITILEPAVKKFNKMTKIEAIITEIPPEILKQISCLDRNSGRNRLYVEFENIANSQSARYKKDVMLLFDELDGFFQQPVGSNTVAFLFCPRYSETFCAFLL